MTPHDLAQIHATAFDTTRAWSAAEFTNLLAQPGTLLTHHARAFVLGRITLDEAEILTLACPPGARRQGHATAALTDFEARAQALGATKLFLEVAEDNTAALALYTRAGMIQTGRRPGYYRTNTGQTVAALILSKALGPA